MSSKHLQSSLPLLTFLGTPNLIQLTLAWACCAHVQQLTFYYTHLAEQATKIFGSASPSFASEKRKSTLIVMQAREVIESNPTE